ncbi:MAG: acetyl-CoA C-acyltransferase, partial [Pirellulales bacterium]
MDAKAYQLENSPVVVACCRSAIGRAHAEHGVFRKVRGDELLASVITAVVRNSKVDPSSIEDVIIGVTQQHGEQGGNIARCASLIADLPFAAAASSVNRLCGSSLQALAQASHAIAAGAEDVHIVGGVDHMHHLPMNSAVDIHPRVFSRSSKGMISMGMTAEYLANTFGISREKQELFAIESHRKAADATSHGRFADEIVPILGHGSSGGICWVATDQSIRCDSSQEAMAELSPAFLPRVGTVTAATSAPLSDGAAAMLVMSKAEAD